MDSLSIQDAGMLNPAGGDRTQSAPGDCRAAARRAVGRAQDRKGLIKGARKSLSYAELIGGKAFSLRIHNTAPLKDPATYTIVGKSVPRLDIPEKVTGTFTYM